MCRRVLKKKESGGQLSLLVLRRFDDSYRATKIQMDVKLKNMIE